MVQTRNYLYDQIDNWLPDVGLEPIRAQEGSAFRRKIIVKNASDRTSTIYFKLVPGDDSGVLNDWITYSPEPPLRNLPPDAEQTITLNFNIPPQVEPQQYHYKMVLEVLQHPGKIVLESQSYDFLVLPKHDRNLPHMTVSDRSSPTAPLVAKQDPFQPSSKPKVSLTITVENTSGLTDRFYLTCPDFEKQWFTVYYGEIDLNRQGLIEEVYGLRLNPKSKGTITLDFHPTHAGLYSPTLQLRSENHEDYILREIVYIDIPPIETLEIRLLPKHRKFPGEPREFQVQVTNTGNIDRKINLLPTQDVDGRFRIQPQSNQMFVNLDPGKSEALGLTFKRSRPWNLLGRPMRGRAIEVPFPIVLKNTKHDELELDQPALPEISPQGVILWQPYTWKHWLMLFGLLCSLGLGAIFVWQMLNKPKPKIEQICVTSTDNCQTSEVNFQLGKEDPKLYTEFRNFEGKQHTIKVTYLQQGDAFSKIIAIDQGTMLKKVDSKDQLTVIAPDKPGVYQFKVEIFSKENPKNPIDTKTSETITIKPAEKPAINKFTTDKSEYQEATNSETTLRLDFALSSSSQITKVQLFVASADGKDQRELLQGTAKGKELKWPSADSSSTDNQVRCNATLSPGSCTVPIRLLKPGNYIFKLVVTSADGNNPSVIEGVTNPITIKPQEIAITEFKVNGRDVESQPKIPIYLSREGGSESISIVWNVKGGKDLVVEMLPAPGRLDKRQGSFLYPLRAAGTETITLKISNPFGDSRTQTAIVQTIVLPSPSNREQPLPSPAPTNENTEVPEESPSNTNKPSSSKPSFSPLPPMELPPQPN